ncbi:MAG: hypothetical protein Q4A55_00780 [Aerococcus sp.]|nr:hypothetical protein [Aerococcus sp.]
MKYAFNQTLTVMGGVFLLVLILNQITDIDFFGLYSFITYITFALVYCLFTYLRKGKAIDESNH